MSSKFDLQIAFDLLKTMTSSNPKPEVVFRRGSNCNEFKNDSNNHITVIGMFFCISPQCQIALKSGHSRRSDDVRLIDFQDGSDSAKLKGSMETAHTQVMTNLWRVKGFSGVA